MVFLPADKLLVAGSELDRYHAEYVGRQAHPASPVERFEKLVGAPLGEFERAWRAYIERMAGLGLRSWDLGLGT
jgi:hypothetical protein